MGLCLNKLTLGSRFVVSYCEFVTFQLVSWVRFGTWLYRFLIFAPLLTLCKYISMTLAWLAVNSISEWHQHEIYKISLFHHIQVIQDVAGDIVISLWSFMYKLSLPSELYLPLQGRETYCFSPVVRLSVRLSVTNRVRSITWKPLKLYSRIFRRMRCPAECKNGKSAFYTFWVISLWTLCITKIVPAL